jgi:hypothetical protein
VNRTRHKLAEAAFFLTKLDEHYYDDLRALSILSESTFSFYLSAFVSAARAVTWIMRSDYSSRSGWEAWYQGQQPSSAEAELLAVFTRLRNRNQKAEPIVATPQMRIAGEAGPPAESDPKMPRLRATFTPVEGGESFGGEIVAFSWSVPELQGEDLLEACRKYLESLEALVEACEREFGE